MTEPQREQAMERFHLLRPFLEEGIALTRIAEQHGQSLRTLRRWVARYRKDGLVGLARKGRGDQGKRRRLAAEMEQLVEGLALQKPPFSAAAIHRRVCDLASRNGEPLPSYSLVLQVLRGLPPALTTLAQEGGKAYSQRFDLIHRREAEGPNAIWQADHTLLDVLLPREGVPPTKPWLTTVIDDYSRAVAGYYLSFEAPSALQSALALRQAIWRKEDSRWHICGIPQILYTDNGSDFTSRHLEQAAADLKIRLVFSTPGKPRGRGRIERFFETVGQMLLCELPGYAPAGGTVRGEPSLTLSDLDGRFREFLLEVYHRREHGETKRPPQQRWEAGGFLPRMPDSLEQLDLLLLTVAKPRRVHPDGIRFSGLRYIDPTLAAYVGEDVLLRYDPRDVAEVRVFHQNRFLCRAICPEISGETVPLRAIVQARNRRRRELRQTLTNRQQIVETLLAVHRPEPPPEPPREQTAGEQAAETSALPAPKLKRYQNE